MEIIEKFVCPDLFLASGLLDNCVQKIDKVRLGAAADQVGHVVCVHWEKVWLTFK